MARKRKKKQEPNEPRFAIGDKVRVRSGVYDADWGDFHLGGWVGTVTGVSHRGEAPVRLEVTWTETTLKQIHPLYRIRCERDGLIGEKYGLSEKEVELDDGSPVVLEQPTNLVNRPLDLDDQEDRIREALGLTSRDDPIPSRYPRSLEKYWRYLVERLLFPFSGRLRSDLGESGPQADEEILVLSLFPVSDFPEAYYLRCEMRRDRHPHLELTPDEQNRRFVVPLQIVEATGEPNAGFLGDYAHWQGGGY